MAILGVHVRFLGCICCKTFPLEVKVERQPKVPFFQNVTDTLKVKNHTPPKINIEPENDGLEDDFPFQYIEFYVRC